MLILLAVGLILAAIASLQIMNAVAGVQTEVKVTASVPLTPENCITTCISRCKNRTIEIGEDFYSEEIEYDN